jgi:hypothetical protein
VLEIGEGESYRVALFEMLQDFGCEVVLRKHGILTKYK